MKVVIPMAGYGTRLRPHTWSKPKPLVTVAGKPVLGHVLDIIHTLPKVDEVVFIVGYLGRQVEEFVTSAYPGLNARYVEQTEMLGQSHAIWLARHDLTGPMMIVFVDTIIDTDLSLASFKGDDAIAWVKPVPDPRRFGVAELRLDGKVHRLVEKPQQLDNNLALVGFYYFREAADLLQAIETQMARKLSLHGEYYLVDAINILLDAGLQMRVESVEVWHDCGKPESLLATNRYLLDHGRDNSAAALKRTGVVIVPPVYIDPTAVITQSVVGPHVSIGAGCEISRTVLLDSIIDAGSQLTDTALSASIIGRDARVVGRYRSLNVGDSSEVGFA
jgi:glucose-1-phosphate thymidylyltransferase